MVTTETKDGFRQHARVLLVWVDREEPELVVPLEAEALEGHEVIIPAKGDLQACKVTTKSLTATCTQTLSHCTAFNSLRPSDAYMRQYNNHALVQII